MSTTLSPTPTLTLKITEVTSNFRVWRNFERIILKVRSMKRTRESIFLGYPWYMIDYHLIFSPKQHHIQLHCRTMMARIKSIMIIAMIVTIFFPLMKIHQKQCCQMIRFSPRWLESPLILIILHMYNALLTTLLTQMCIMFWRKIVNIYVCSFQLAIFNRHIFWLWIS